MAAGQHAASDLLRVSRRQFLSLTAASVGAVTLAACTGSQDSPLASNLPTSPRLHGITSGLDFPGSAAVKSTMRFRFIRPLPIYPATYIWRAYPRQQAGYYTAFFWGNDDGKNDLSTFLWVDRGRTADSYYGAHPYPDVPPNGMTHKWEISIERQDFVKGAVVYDRWYTQALRVWAEPSGVKRHEFYWDLPRANCSSVVRRTSNANWGNRMPPAPTLTLGDAPWNPGKEVWNGMLCGFQIYSTKLSVREIMSEIDRPLSTNTGLTGIWYLNLSPTPGDIFDRSGQGNHPEWVGTERPTIWTP